MSTTVKEAKHSHCTSPIPISSLTARDRLLCLESPDLPNSLSLAAIDPSDCLRVMQKLSFPQTVYKYVLERAGEEEDNSADAKDERTSYVLLVAFAKGMSIYFLSFTSKSEDEIEVRQTAELSREGAKFLCFDRTAQYFYMS